MILEKANSNNIAYIRSLEASHADILDLPNFYTPSSSKLRHEGEWNVIRHKEGIAGIIGIAHSIETKEGDVIKFVQVVIEKEFRGRGLFSEAFTLITQEYPNVKRFRLTTINTNKSMQKAAHKAGFDFIRSFYSPNGTGNILYLYEYVSLSNTSISKRLMIDDEVCSTNI